MSRQKYKTAIHRGQIFENYLIYEDGRVWSKKGQKFLAYFPSSSGYHKIALPDRQVKVHHLVAEAFIGPRPEGLTIDHIDNNKLNNHYSNLEYVTLQENLHRAYVNGSKDNVCIGVIGTDIKSGVMKEYKSISDAALDVSGNRKYASSITLCLSGKRTTAYGHTWRKST